MSSELAAIPSSEQRRRMSSGTATYMRSATIGTSIMQRSHGTTLSSSSSSRTPVGSPKPKIGTHTHRLYKAPQASIRGGDLSTSLHNKTSSSTLSRYEEPSNSLALSSSGRGGGNGAAARRRRGSQREATLQTVGIGFSLDRLNSNLSLYYDRLALCPPNSSLSRMLLPEAPVLWWVVCV